MKKIGFVIVMILVIAFVWNATHHASHPTVAVEEKPNSSVVSVVTQPAIQPDQGDHPKDVIAEKVEKNIDMDDVQQKTSKAIQNIQKKSRLPNGNLKVNSEMLVEHEAFNGTRWKIWPEVRAARRDAVTSDDVVVARLSRFDVVENAAVAQFPLRDFDRNSLAVVYQTRLKKVGVVTGLIQVGTERKDLLLLALQESDAQIENSFDEIQTYYISSRQTRFNLEKLYLYLKALPFVKSVELDILDRDYEKK